MTLTAYYNWLRQDWPKAGLLISLFLTVYLVVLVLPKSTLSFALLMATPLYMLHEVEEYVSPGGFAQWMNTAIYKADPETGPVNPTAVLLINMVAIWIILPHDSLAAVTDPSHASWMPYFFMGQAVVHLAIGMIGKRLINPGMLTAWLVHVPWAIWTIWLLVQAGVIANPYWNDDVLLGVLINIALLPVLGLVLVTRFKLLPRFKRKQQHT